MTDRDAVKGLEDRVSRLEAALGQVSGGATAAPRIPVYADPAAPPWWGGGWGGYRPVPVHWPIGDPAPVDYTRIYAPTNGIVDTRVALSGEVVNPGQAIVTLINQDDLWVRADVEETYIDQIHIGDPMTVRLPSGTTRQGTVFFRGVDADFATQRDVSRTKRDIRTFEIRLRCDNRDRSLAVGMTAYVTLPLAHHRVN